MARVRVDRAAKKITSYHPKEAAMRRLFDRHLALVALIAGGMLALSAATTVVAQTSGKKPNILVIMTDDVGVWNISAYRNNSGCRTV